MSIKELRQQLRELGLDSSGNKAALKHRLDEFQNKPPAPAPAPAPAPSPASSVPAPQPKSYRHKPPTVEEQKPVELTLAQQVRGQNQFQQAQDKNKKDKDNGESSTQTSQQRFVCRHCGSNFSKSRLLSSHKCSKKLQKKTDIDREEAYQKFVLGPGLLGKSGDAQMPIALAQQQLGSLIPPQDNPVTLFFEEKIPDQKERGAEERKREREEEEEEEEDSDRDDDESGDFDEIDEEAEEDESKKKKEEDDSEESEEVKFASFRAPASSKSKKNQAGPVHPPPEYLVKLVDQISDLKNLNHALKREKTQVTKEAEELQGRHTRMKKNMDDQIRRLTAEVADFKIEMSRIKTESQEKQNSFLSLKNEITSLKKQNLELKKEASKVLDQTQIHNIQHENKRLKEETHTLKQQIDALNGVGVDKMNYAELSYLLKHHSDSLMKLHQAMQHRVEKMREGLRDTRACKICLDADIDCLIVPCYHVVACLKCSSSVANCPICRQRIVERKKIHT